jgi:tetratricopeptide (TPR) repeat protein
LAAAIELLSFLGRDEDIVVLSEAAQDRGIADPRCRAMVLHHLAVAQCRLGDEKAARSSWKKCLKAMPTYTDARENLDDLDSGKGHAPWSESIVKWIPEAIFDNMLDSSSSIGQARDLDLTNDYPAVAALIPALLDRGDPLGREMAMKMAVAEGSPAMLDALQQFAFGLRGPDAMRNEVLNILGERGHVDSGPHRFYCRGKWTEVKLFMAEINWERTECATPGVRDLVETGTEALSNGDFTLAEESFNRILDMEPDNCCAAFNLCLVWLERDGRVGRRRAQARMEEIRDQFPDYLFARISLAQFAAIDGDLDRASDLLEPVFCAKRLHASEAIALFTAQVQIAVKRREFDSAEQSLELLAQFAGEDDPKVVKLRRFIHNASGRHRLRQLLPWA